jgi:hypothetical protein
MSLPNRVLLIFESFEMGFTAMVVFPNVTLKKSTPWYVIIMKLVYKFFRQKKSRLTERGSAGGKLIDQYDDPMIISFSA